MCVCVFAQSCPNLCDSMDCSTPGSSVHGILQARILEWLAISSSRGASWCRDQAPVPWGFCIGRQILYHWVTWEVPSVYHIHFHPWLGYLGITNFGKLEIWLFKAKFVVHYYEHNIRNAWLDDSQAGIKTAGINVNNIRYADDTTLIGRKWGGTKEPLHESGEWKSWLKTQHSKN